MYKGEALFVASNPAVGKIIAFEKHDVAGETTVYIDASRITFVRGVAECLKHTANGDK